MSLTNMRQNGVRAVTATCANCGRSADVSVDALPETLAVPRPANASDAAAAAARRYRPGPPGTRPDARASQTFDRMKSREEQLTWAKQRAHICVDIGEFAYAVAALRANLDENPLTKGVVPSDQALGGYKAAMDAALGRVRKR